MDRLTPAQRKRQRAGDPIEKDEAGNDRPAGSTQYGLPISASSARLTWSTGYDLPKPQKKSSLSTVVSGTNIPIRSTKSPTAHAQTSKYWDTKLRRNQEKDREHHQILCKVGWQVLTLWECEVKRTQPKRFGSAAPEFLGWRPS